MAIYIKSIPTLKGRLALKFESIANDNASKRASIDFSKQVNEAKSILSKSKLHY